VVTGVVIAGLAAGGVGLGAALLSGGDPPATGTTPAAAGRSGTASSGTASSASTTPSSVAGELAPCEDAPTLGVPPAYLEVWRELLAAQAAEQDCASVRPVGVESWTVRLDPSRVQAWAPEELAWTARGEKPLPSIGKPVLVARTPVVLALSQDRMRALGGARKLTTPAVLGPLVRLERRLPATSAEPAAGLRIALPDPSRSLTGAIGFGAVGAVAAGAPITEAPSYVGPSDRELTYIRTEHRMRLADDDAAAIDLLSEGRVSAALTTEALAIRHGTDPEARPLAAAYLPGAVDRMQLITLQPQARAAVERLAAYLHSASGREALLAAGLRPATGSATPPASTPLPTGDYRDPDPAPTPKAATAQINAVGALFGFMHVRISSLVLVDASGSMLERLPDAAETKVDLVRTAAHDALRVSSPTARSGLVTFHSAPADDRMRVEVTVPLARNGAPGRAGETHADELLGAVDRLQVAGGTPLYNAVRRGYGYALDHYARGYVNQVVVLSDGENRDARGSITRDDVLRYLRGTADPKRPVRIIAVGIGPDADMPTLRRIAAATGGKAVWLQPASQYAEVLRQALFTP